MTKNATMLLTVSQSKAVLIRNLVNLVGYGACIHPDALRVRIVRFVGGEVDGIPLRTFQVGVTYDVNPSLGSYLIIAGAAEPVDDDRTASSDTKPASKAGSADRQDPTTPRR